MKIQKATNFLLDELLLGSPWILCVAAAVLDCAIYFFLLSIKEVAPLQFQQILFVVPVLSLGIPFLLARENSISNYPALDGKASAWLLWIVGIAYVLMPIAWFLIGFVGTMVLVLLYWSGFWLGFDVSFLRENSFPSVIVGSLMLIAPIIWLRWKLWVDGESNR